MNQSAIRNMQSYRRIVVNNLTTDFRKACQIVTAKLPELTDDDVLVKVRYVGINASDINVTAGRYGPLYQKVPYGIGFEGIGEVVDVGGNVSSDIIGQAVAYMYNGCFAEYTKLPFKYCIPVPDVKPEYISLLVSGLTASIALVEVGKLSTGKTVLVTAAAGGTGHIAVQIAKSAGCHVIGTCSSEQKSEFLRSIGCDHAINYNTEPVAKVLKQNYPKGIDIAYESVGGELFKACLNNMAVNGTIIALGYINSYYSTAGIDRNMRNATLVTKLLQKSASVSGFFLLNHAKSYKEHLPKLVNMFNEGQLKLATDLEDIDGNKFSGLPSVFDAVEHLYSRKSKGKVIVEIPHTTCLG